MSTFKNTVVIKCCTDALGNPFQKIYYGIDDEIVSGRELTLNNPISDFAFTFTQSIKQQQLSSNMYFLRLDDGLAIAGTNESSYSVLLGTASISLTEYNKIYVNLRDIAQALHIHLVHLQENEDIAYRLNNRVIYVPVPVKERDIILEEYGHDLGKIEIDQSVSVTTEEDFIRLTKD